MQSVIAEFELNDFTIEYRLGGNSTSGRYLIYSLVGPRSFWPVYESIVFKEIGEFKAKIFNEQLPINIDFPAEIKIRPSYSMEKISENDKMQGLTK